MLSVRGKAHHEKAAATAPETARLPARRDTYMALSAAAVRAAGLGETRAWLADTGLEGTWHEATVVERGEGGTATLRRDDGVGDPIVVSAEELKLVNVLPEQGVEDMTKLDYLHEPALLNNLRRRFGRDQLYTYTGRICIAVNPFNWQVRAASPRLGLGQPALG